MLRGYNTGGDVDELEQFATTAFRGKSEVRLREPVGGPRRGSSSLDTTMLIAVLGRLSRDTISEVRQLQQVLQLTILQR